MRLQLARRSRHAGAAAFIDKAQKASRFSPTPWKAMKNIEQHYEQIELSEMAIERERLWTNWGFQSGVNKVLHLAALLISFGVCGALHFGVGSCWIMARGLEAVQALRSKQWRCSISATSSGFEHRLIHFNGTWFEFIWIPHVSTGFAKSQAWVERASRVFAILLSILHWSHQHFDLFFSRYEFQLLLRHVLRERFPSAKDVPQELFKELWLKHTFIFFYSISLPVRLKSHCYHRLFRDRWIHPVTLSCSTRKFIGIPFSCPDMFLSFFQFVASEGSLWKIWQRVSWSQRRKRLTSNTPTFQWPLRISWRGLRATLSRNACCSTRKPSCTMHAVLQAVHAVPVVGRNG